MSDNERVITFDFYGTLVQWHEGLHSFVDDHLSENAKSPAMSVSLLEDFHTTCRALRDNPPYKSYRSILDEGMRTSMERRGMKFTGHDFARLLRRIEELSVFPEVPAVLARFKERGFRLALISNSDDDIIGPCVVRSGLPIDEVVTAQRAQAYKPDVRLFTFAHEVLGVEPRDVTHVAASMTLDMPVCKRLGIKAIWVDRRGEDPIAEYQPYWTAKNLTEAATFVP